MKYTVQVSKKIYNQILNIHKKPPSWCEDTMSLSFSFPTTTKKVKVSSTEIDMLCITNNGIDFLNFSSCEMLYENPIEDTIPKNGKMIKKNKKVHISIKMKDQIITN